MPTPAQPGSVLGIDTHKLTHVAAIVDRLGRMQGTFAFAATDAGAAELLTWATGHGSPRTAGVEGTGSYGYQLTRALQAAGITVLEVNRPDRATQRRKARATPSTPRQPPGPSWPAKPKPSKEPSRTRRTPTCADDCPQQRGESHDYREPPDQGDSGGR